MSTVTKRLQSLKLKPDTMVSLIYSEGADCFMHTEDQVETAIANTDVITRFAELITTPGLNVQTRWGSNIISEIRENGFLDEYERDYSFTEYIENTITDNYYDMEFIESSTEAYDYKRGFCTLTADVVATVGEIIDSGADLSGWEVSVSTENGTLTFDA